MDWYRCSELAFGHCVVAPADADEGKSFTL